MQEEAKYLFPVTSLRSLYSVSINEALMGFLYFAISVLLRQEKMREDLRGQEKPA